VGLPPVQRERARRLVERAWGPEAGLLREPAPAGAKSALGMAL
jgi:hypothetical protein